MNLHLRKDWDRNRVQDYIFRNLSKMPDENLSEMLDFMIFIQNKKKISENYFENLDSLEEILSEKSKKERLHLESEFEDYKIKFPHE